MSRIALAAMVVGTPVAAAIAADASVVNASQPAPAECMPCGDPADCGPSGFARSHAPRCAPPPGEPVQLAIDGLTSYASNHPAFYGGFGSVILDDCPILGYDALGELLEGDLPVGVELRNAAHVQRDQSTTVPGASFEVLSCGSTAVPAEGSPVASVQLTVSVFAEPRSIEELTAANDQFEFHAFAEYGTSGACADAPADSPRPGRSCRQLWADGRLVVGLTVDSYEGVSATASEEALGAALAAMLPDVLANLAALPAGS